MEPTICFNKEEAGELMRANFRVLCDLRAERERYRVQDLAIPATLQPRIERVEAINSRLTSFVDGVV